MTHSLNAINDDLATFSTIHKLTEAQLECIHEDATLSIAVGVAHEVLESKWDNMMTGNQPWELRTCCEFDCDCVPF